MKESTIKRYKLLCLFAIHLDIWEDKLPKLGKELENGNPEALKALSFYEDKLIEVLELPNEQEK